MEIYGHKVRKSYPSFLFGYHDKHARQLLVSYNEASTYPKWAHLQEMQISKMTSNELAIEIHWIQRRISDVEHERSMGEYICALGSLILSVFLPTVIDLFTKYFSGISFQCTLLSVFLLWLIVFLAVIIIFVPYSWKRQRELLVYKAYLQLLERNNFYDHSNNNLC